MGASCWEENVEYGPEDDHGWPAVHRSTCLLPDDHDGPHEFTPDNQIMVQFVGPRRPPVVRHDDSKPWPSRNDEDDRP